MHPFPYPYVIPPFPCDIEAYQSRHMQKALTHLYTMPNDHDKNSTAVESWMFLEQRPALDVFQPFNQFPVTLPQQGICLKKPTADFHQLNGMQQPVEVCFIE